MKKTIIGLALGILLFPAASFAQTTGTDYQSALLQLIALLTQQVQSLEAQLLSNSGAIPTEPTGAVQVKMTSDTAYHANSGPVYDIAMTVTNGTDKTIYIPATMNYVSEQGGTSNAPGFAYTLNVIGGGKVEPGTGGGMVSCSPQVDVPIQGPLGYVQSCEIKAGQSGNISFTPNPVPDVEGNYFVSLASFSYTTTLTNPSFTILSMPSNQTNTYINLP